MMPPVKSHPKAEGLMAFKIFVNASTHVQPIPMYKTEDTHFGQYTQKALIRMPMSAMLHTSIKRGRPTLLSRTKRQIGV
jgi:hypothetical protein